LYATGDSTNRTISVATTNTEPFSTIPVLQTEVGIRRCSTCSTTTPNSARLRLSKPSECLDACKSTTALSAPLPSKLQENDATLQDYDAACSNTFDVYENIGLTSGIRRAIMAYIDRVREHSNDVKIIVPRSEIVDIMTATAGEQECHAFMQNIEAIFPTADYKIVLRRTEADGVARCIAFHKDDADYTMAIPLNAPGDECTGGQLVYMDETGPQYVRRWALVVVGGQCKYSNRIGHRLPAGTAANACTSNV
jgi:hypothetical protein